jgi:cytochrome c5
MRITVISILLLILAACSAKLYVPSEQNVNKRETASLTDLQQGHDLFKNKCGNCHKLPSPSSYDAAKWTKILEKMGPKAKLNQDQVALVYKYVVNY